VESEEFVLAVVGTAIAALALLVGYLQLKKKEARTTHVQANVGPIDASTHVGPVHVDARPIAVLPTLNRSFPSATSQEPKRRTERSREVVVEDVVDVENASHAVFELDLCEGDRVKGVAEEQTGQEFNAFVFDEEGYAEFSRTGDTTDAVFESEDESSHAIEFVATSDDTHYVVLDTYGKQNNRTVRVRLKRTHSARLER